MASAIIVFSHQPWDFVYRRPQHIMSRLAAHHQIVFIEEPRCGDGRARLDTSSPVPGVLLCRPHTPVEAEGFHDGQLPHLRRLLRQVARDFDDHIAWFYTPMALPLLRELHPRLVVYDCMEHAAGFKNAPIQLPQRESALLQAADLVLAGGHGLHRALRGRHPNLHCVPSSVDAAHFEPALDRANSHPAHRDIPGPRLGYYGVLDERIDVDLIGKVADAHPRWQLVLVGPVRGIAPGILPKRANIHYLGQQPYHALPQFLAGWDVCLLPFALNEATRHCCPVKVLEYMAAELPVVATPVPDVVHAHGEAVTLAADAPAFIAACEQALLAPPQAHAERIGKMRALLADTSWDATVEHIRALLASAQHNRACALEAATGVRDGGRPAHAGAPRYAATAIIGAGPTGLSAAYHLGHDAVLFERHAMVGGWCRSIKDNGFTFDHAGHIMFSDDPYVLRMYRTLLGSNLHWQQREAWIYSKDVYTRYPFQGALYGLPPDVIRECIMGAIAARYGHLPACVPGAPQVQDCCADGGVALPASNVAPLERRATDAAPANFEEFIYRVWGEGIARHFAIPYNRKLWAVPLSQMDTAWLGGRVPLPDLDEIIAGALQPPATPVGPNARFGYPLRGGFQALMSGFVPHIKGTIELNADVTRILPRQRIIVLADGRRYQYQNLISTMPLPELVRVIGEDAPPEVLQAASRLQHVSVRCVNLGVAREHITDKHWIYYPEDTIFHRIFAQGNASPECNPPGGFGLTCEISYSPRWKPLPCEGQALIERCVADCIRVGLLRADDRIIAANEIDMPYAYVVYDHERERNVRTIRAWLERHGIVSAGRYGEWEYYNSDHAFIAGKKAADAVKWAEPMMSLAAE